MHKEKIEFKENSPFSIKIQAINNYPIHWHEDIIEILLPIKGSIEVFANFEQILVTKNDFWFVNNKSIHSIRSSSQAIVAVFHIDLNYFEKNFKYIKYMFFRNNMYSEDKIKIKSDNYQDDIKKGHKTRFRNLLVSILTDVTDDDPLSKKFIKDSISQLISSMVYEFNWLQFLKKSSDNISTLQLDRYHRTVKFIDKNYMERMTLDDVAKQEFITKNYFSHFWKDISYFSFNERLNYERVIKSEFLLLTTDMSISSISQECGFSDIKYYYKHFKRWYKCRPLEHKKRCFSYMDKKLNYRELDLTDVLETIDNYIKNTILPEYAQNDIWRSTDLFSDYIKLKYLYKIDKVTPQRTPRNVIIDAFNPKNFKIHRAKTYFNWQNIDMLVNFSETSDFSINIKLDCSYLDEKWFKDVVKKFLNSCIYRYRIVTVEKWRFYIHYNDEISFNHANTIGDLIREKIKDINIVYYFEV